MTFLEFTLNRESGKSHTLKNFKRSFSKITNRLSAAIKSFENCDSSRARTLHANQSPNSQEMLLRRSKNSNHLG